jgi:hypothetical protein
MGETRPPDQTPLTDFRFGSIAVWAGYLAAQALDSALEDQAARRRRGEDAPRIGEFLVSLGQLTDDKVQRVLKVQLQRLPDEGHVLFGQIAGVNRLVSRDDIQHALDEQSRDILAGGDVRRIGEILFHMGRLDEESSKAILAYQANADAIPLAEAKSASSARQSEHGPSRGAGGPATDGPLPAASPERPGFLPKGAAGFVLDQAIWVILGLSAASALALTLWREAIFGS